MRQITQSVVTAIAIALVGGIHTAGAYSLAPYEHIPTPAHAGSVAIGDFDGDGNAEIAIAIGRAADDSQAARLLFYRFDPLINTFVQVWSMPLPKHYPYEMTMVPARTRGDGRLTLAVGTERTMSIVDWQGAVATARTVTTPFRMQVVQALDLDGDGLDEVIGQGHSEGAILFKSDGHAGVSIQRQFPTAARGFNDASVGDLDADGRSDWVVMSGQLYSAPNAEIFYSSGVGDFLPGSNAFRVEASVNTGGIAAGDIDGDGRDDLVLTRPRNSPTWIYALRQDAAGSFVQSTAPAFDIPEDVAIADLVGDGSRQVIVVHSGWSTLSRYSHGNAGLELAEMVAVPYGDYGPTAIATGDVSGDGCADVVVAGGASGVAVLRGQACAATSDVSPDPFGFAPRSGVEREAIVTSDAVTITGIDVAVSVSVAGGEYSRNGAAFTATPGVVEAGDVLQLRHTASPEFATTRLTDVTVGDFSTTFRSTTVAADPTPDTFSFAARTNLPRSSMVVSEVVVLSGFNLPLALSVSGGEVSINGGTFSAATSQVSSGDRVQLRHVASNEFSTTVSTSITVGATAAEFVSTTEAADGTPDVFRFSDVTAAPRKTWILSEEVVITGINLPVTVSISGAGSYAVNGGAFRTSASMLTAGDRVVLRVRSANAKFTTVATTLTVGDRSDHWTVTTGQ